MTQECQTMFKMHFGLGDEQSVSEAIHYFLGDRNASPWACVLMVNHEGVYASSISNDINIQVINAF